MSQQISASNMSGHDRSLSGLQPQGQHNEQLPPYSPSVPPPSYKAATSLRGLRRDAILLQQVASTTNWTPTSRRQRQRSSTINNTIPLQRSYLPRPSPINICRGFICAIFLTVILVPILIHFQRQNQQQQCNFKQECAVPYYRTANYTRISRGDQVLEMAQLSGEADWTAFKDEQGEVYGCWWSDELGYYLCQHGKRSVLISDEQSHEAIEADCSCGRE